MSKLQSDHVFTSESVSEGHPDKICDQISDAVLDACLASDPNSRVACETLVTTNLAVIAGEISTKASSVDYEALARDTIRRIGYTHEGIGFDADHAEVQVRVHEQSPDIAQGVNEGAGAYKEQGAGDQGMMFGYASDETPELMPAPILYSHKLVKRLAELRHAGGEVGRYLRPDSKSQVSINYKNGAPHSINTVVVSHQHTEEMQDAWLVDLVRHVTAEVIPGELLHAHVKYLVNPTGRFVVGGPHGDCGLTGRKIIVDTYGGVGAHGGGAFSGKDPSKVDRSAAYMCRYIAKNIVAAKLAKRCEVQVAYAIGYPLPVSVNVDTYGTGEVEDEQFQKILESNEVFDLRPAGIVRMLRLKTPFAGGWRYQQTAAYGHFGRGAFPWEQADKTADLRSALGA